MTGGPPATRTGPSGLSAIAGGPAGSGTSQRKGAGSGPSARLLLEAGIRRLAVAERHRARATASAERARFGRRERVDRREPSPSRRSVPTGMPSTSIGPPGTTWIRIGTPYPAGILAGHDRPFRLQLRDAGGPPYRQLIDGVRRQIERGVLLPGDRLPPVRVLADELDLAPNTVARAYRSLEDDGWIEGRGRAGTFVADRLPERPVRRRRRPRRGRRRVPAPGGPARGRPGGRDPGPPAAPRSLTPAIARCSTRSDPGRTLLERMFDVSSTPSNAWPRPTARGRC